MQRDNHVSSGSVSHSTYARSANSRNASAWRSSVSASSPSACKRSRANSRIDSIRRKRRLATPASATINDFFGERFEHVDRFPIVQDAVYGARGIQREAPCEYGHDAKRPSLVRLEQLITPVDERGHRPLPWIAIAAGTRERAKREADGQIL